MKWYRVLQNESPLANALVADVVELGATTPDELEVCSEVTNWPSSAWIGVGPDGRDGEPDDALQNAFGLHVHSPRLRAALKKVAIDGIQYLPIAVRRSDGSVLSTFFTANVLRCSWALDKNTSSYSVYPPDYFIESRRGRLASLREPVLRRTALAGLDIVRLSEFPPSLFVSERFVGAFRLAGCTGYDFMDVVLS